MSLQSKQSKQLFERAEKVIPGGVNSPVRGFGSVGGRPRFIKKAEGAYIYDVDGNRYIDFIGSWGPMILGHNHKNIGEAVKQAVRNGLSFGAATEMEVNMAELICSLVPSIEMIRMVNSGTEAVMSAIRVARGYTKRNKIVKFAGCYHGHSDSMLVKSGSGVMTAGIPDSAGVPEGCAQDTLTATYNNIDTVEALFKQYKGQIAALIVEPVAANMGVVEPAENFLKQLRSICDKNGTVFIMDEVITGFRLGITGAQGYYGVNADLTVYGKIIGAGMPVGAYGGKREIMQMISPLGSVYQAGTLSGNPVAMAAGFEELNILKSNPHIYEEINEIGEYFRRELKELLRSKNLTYQVTGVGSLSCLFFTKNNVINYETAKTSDIVLYGKFFNFMLNQGIYLAPSQFEAMFLSYAHTKEQLKITLQTIKDFFRQEELKI